MGYRVRVDWVDARAPVPVLSKHDFVKKKKRRCGFRSFLDFFFLLSNIWYSPPLLFRRCSCHTLPRLGDDNTSEYDDNNGDSRGGAKHHPDSDGRRRGRRLE